MARLSWGFDDCDVEAGREIIFEGFAHRIRLRKVVLQSVTKKRCGQPRRVAQDPCKANRIPSATDKIPGGEILSVRFVQILRTRGETREGVADDNRRDHAVCAWHPPQKPSRAGWQRIADTRGSPPGKLLVPPRAVSQAGQRCGFAGTFFPKSRPAFLYDGGGVAAILGAPVHVLTRDSAEQMSNPYRRASILVDAKVIYRCLSRVKDSRRPAARRAGAAAARSAAPTLEDRNAKKA